MSEVTKVSSESTESTRDAFNLERLKLYRSGGGLTKGKILYAKLAARVASA